MTRNMPRESVKFKNHTGSFFVSSILTSGCLFFVLSFVLYSARGNQIPGPHLQSRLSDSLPLPFIGTTTTTRLSYDGSGLENFDPMDALSLEILVSPESPNLVAPQSVTAILPVLPGSLDKIESLLEPFLHPLEHVCEVVIICPDAIASDVRRVLQKTFVLLGSPGHPDISLRPWKGHTDFSTAILRASMDAVSGWTLIMDDTGLTEVSRTMRDVLLNPPSVSLPFGPRGALQSEDSPSTKFADGWSQPARYVCPPFLVSSSLLTSVGKAISPTPNLWASLGERISKNRADTIGGTIITVHDSSASATSTIREAEPSSIIDFTPLAVWEPNSLPLVPDVASACFAFLLPTRNDLRLLAPLMCAMKTRNKDIRMHILVYAATYDKPTNSDWETEFFETYRCDIKYEVLTGRTPLSFASDGSVLLSQWLMNSPFINMVFTLSESDHLVSYIANQKDKVFHDATHIRMPRIDLVNTEWMSSLTLEEWQKWHRPRIDISIITKDRPASLTRLLNSLQKARYFGDQLDLRINVEQNCDAESLQIAENITWPFGRVFIHHRVVHGGLLPAVVESWYPRDNHSYGLLLEDDIEVSPLYYAWLKMTTLRYRYGDPSNRTPKMFGISLYQQKHLELPTEGRQSFNPRALFAKTGLPHAHTPYLSPVPCSWGAIYFPEHWREFHDYLAIRLGETVLAIEDDVVPDVRSNHWSKSWKKFFIELVYLRGYVMLYPNYEDFVSLSTNHLEVGSHVKIRSPEKRDLFLLPLMELHKPRESSKLLDLPNHSLPSLQALPILNLTGHLTSLESLVKQGHSRRAELVNCDCPFDLYNIRSLMCVSDTLASGLFR